MKTWDAQIGWHISIHLCNQRTKFNETFREAWSKRPLFLGRSEKPRYPTWTLIGWNIIQRNLASSRYSMSSTKFVLLGPTRKQRVQPCMASVWMMHCHILCKIKMAALASGWEIFVFCSAITEQNSSELERKQDLKIICQVCFSGQ